MKRRAEAVIATNSMAKKSALGLMFGLVALLVGVGMVVFVIGYESRQQTRQAHRDAAARVANLANATYTTNVATYKAQLASCARGNRLRVVINANGSILRSFLSSAETARTKIANDPGTSPGARKVNAAAAASYARLIARSHPVALVNCHAVYPAPRKDDGQ